MGKAKTAIQLLTNPKEFNKALASDIQYSRLAHVIPDSVYLRMIYRLSLGRKLNLKTPVSYNEKIQWIKLYDRRPEYIEFVDKIEVRKHVAETIGSEYLIPIFGYWKHFDEIDFDSLPNEFVLKCNHDSGSVVICKDKSTFDKATAKLKLEKAVNRNMFYFGREWPYKEVIPFIMAEKYMEDSPGSGSLTDYKVYCFDGEPKVIMMASSRFTNKTFDYLDVDFNWLDLEWGAPRSSQKPQKPSQYDKIINLARLLSENLPEVRVDFYVSNDKVFFGEMTFFDGSGFEEITPYTWDLKLGEWIRLGSKI